jgi:hypothetical protein
MTVYYDYHKDAYFIKGLYIGIIHHARKAEYLKVLGI